MNANHSRKSKSSLRHIKKGAHAVRKTFVTLGDLVSAAYEVTGTPDAAARLLSPFSPLSRMLGRRIIIAT